MGFMDDFNSTQGWAGLATGLSQVNTARSTAEAARNTAIAAEHAKRQAAETARSNKTLEAMQSDQAQHHKEMQRIERQKLEEAENARVRQENQREAEKQQMAMFRKLLTFTDSYVDFLEHKLS